MDRLLLQSRRRFIGGLATLAATPAHALAAGTTTYGILVAGPIGSRTDRWADILVPAFGRGLASKGTLLRENTGGIDGVTGANQFDARVEPDGTTAMLVPGAAVLSWLVGERRARFEPARWVPLWAGLGGVMLFSRTLPKAGRPFTVVASSPAGPELGVLLALDILGIEVRLAGPDTYDGAVLVGPSSTMTATLAAQAGLQPIMSFGALTAQGTIGRDPDHPGVPTVSELTRERAPKEILAALQSAIMTTQLDVGLVLPAMTSGASVAVWRRACAAMTTDPTMQRDAARMGVRQPPPDLVAACTSGIVGNSETLLTLRRWLATRYDWRPA